MHGEDNGKMNTESVLK